MLCSEYQIVECEHPGHEFGLIDGRLQGVLAKLCQPFFGQVSTPIEIAHARLVGSGKFRLVFFRALREPSGHRLQACSIYATRAERCIDGDPRDTSISIKEGVNPHQSMMGGESGKNAFQIVRLVSNDNFADVCADAFANVFANAPAKLF